MRVAYRVAAGLVAVGAVCLVPSASWAGTVTDLNISSYTTGFWSGQSNNGSLIAAAPTSGNTSSGLTFGDWAGSYFVVGPDAGSSGTSPQTITFAPSVTLNGDAVVNTLINSFYGVSGQVDATITFANNSSATAQFSLIGGDTIRDYNNYDVNALQGYNTGTGYGSVTAQNWWNDGSSGQRLDAQTFALPASWSGTTLVSMTISDPWGNTQTNDVVLSAVQVNDQTPTVPEPMSFALLLVGLGATAVAAGTRSGRQPSRAGFPGGCSVCVRRR